MSAPQRNNSLAAGRCVVVGLSGGVDSAVAAILLRQQGYAVHGVTLETWHASPESAEHHTATEAVAAHLGIPLVRCDVRQAFYTRVVEPFLDGYAKALTPNPCVRCNPILKFATLLEEADRIGAAWIATGHYARVARSVDGSAHLLRARTGEKDQSYALYRLTQRHLSRLLLPLGDLGGKPQVREIARALGLPAAEAKESQDLCFVGSGGYAGLLATLRPDAMRPGPILGETGSRLGDHQGLARYTVGQRDGLGITAPYRLYVLELDVERNALIVGPRERLARESCWLTDVTFTNGAPPLTEPALRASDPVGTGRPRRFEAAGRIRYRSELTPITVTPLALGEAHIRFAEPQVGVSPGQSLVFYSGDEVLGGGIITKHIATHGPQVDDN
jgi:tRNA-specific 2-thiouridylase